jgi:hypothetical protein
MPQVGWIDALRRWNLGGTSWCIPRKGTAGYDTVMKIRRGEEAKTTKELIDELERKTGGKPKSAKRILRVQLEPEPAPQMEAKVEIPTAEKPKKKTVKAMVPKEDKKEEPPADKGDHMADLDAQIAKELDTGRLSLSYDLDWKPKTDTHVKSGGVRDEAQITLYKKVVPKATNTYIDVRAIERHLESIPRVETVRTFEEYYDAEKRKEAEALLTMVRTWRPKNEYYGHSNKETKEAEDEYMKFVNQAAAVRGKRFHPSIRPKSVVVYHPDGTKTARFTFGDEDKLMREYQISPELKLLRGTTIEELRASGYKAPPTFTEKIEKARATKKKIQQKYDEGKLTKEAYGEQIGAINNTIRLLNLEAEYRQRYFTGFMSQFS